MDTDERSQQKIRETMTTEGARIIAERLRMVARETLRQELKSDPFTHPGEIIKARQLRYVIKTLIPRIIEGYVNYDPETPDKQVTDPDKFNVMQWLRERAVTAER